MNINFKRENGSCPYFIYKNTKYLIRDWLDNDTWMYYLAEKDIREKIIKLETYTVALGYIKNLLGIRYVFENRDMLHLFEDKNNDYIVNKNIIKIRNKPSRITLDYSNYYDCLKEAKRIVENRIKQEEPEQIKLC